MPSKMPRPSMNPTVSPFTIEALLMEFNSFDEQTAAREYPWADRFVMGLPLPHWQRDFKWSEEQSQRFITSAWTGIYLGTYVVTSMELRPEDVAHKGVEHIPLSNCVIEGQQRLKTLELYFTDKLAVPDADGKLALWSDVDILDQRRLKKVIFSKGEIREHNEDKLIEFYNLLNYGGTAHEPEERAAKTSRVRP